METVKVVANSANSTADAASRSQVADRTILVQSMWKLGGGLAATILLACGVLWTEIKTTSSSVTNTASAVADIEKLLVKIDARMDKTDARLARMEEKLVTSTSVGRSVNGSPTSPTAPDTRP